MRTQHPAIVALVVLALGLMPSAPVAGQSDAGLPPCDPTDMGSVSCRLETWPPSGAAALRSAFGIPESEGSVWVEDAVGDAPPGGLDVLAVGTARVQVEDVASLRRGAEILRAGNRRQAIREGQAVLVRTVLATAPDAVTEGHAGVFVATDVDGVLSNDAPSGVEAPDGPFAGFQQVFSLNVAAGEEPDLLFSDLSRGWYKGRGAFAAHRPVPEVVDMLVPAERFGEGVRVATFGQGPAGRGYDVAGVGPTLAPIPLDGTVDVLPRCLEASVSTQPFTVERLVENGQSFRDIETPRSFSATATFSLTDEERGVLEALIAGADEDGDGSLPLAGEAVLVEEGLNVRQAPRLSVHLQDGQAVLSVQVGLTRRGFIVIRDLELEPTGDVVADAVLSRSVNALAQAVPPFRVARRSGSVLTSAAAPCVAAGESTPASA